MSNGPVAANLVLAHPVQRILAFLIDAAIVTVINLGFATILGLDSVEQRRAFALFIAVTATYHIVSVAVRSATPGKTLMGIYISYGDGQSLRPDTAILRYVVLLVGNMLFIGTIVSLVLVFVDPAHRTIHDRVAATLVLQGRAPGRRAGWNRDEAAAGERKESRGSLPGWGDDEKASAEDTDAKDPVEDNKESFPRL